MKLRCDIEIPSNDYRAKLDAMAKASRDESMWRVVKTRKELMEETSFDNKCGSCKYFKPMDLNWTSCYGECLAGHVDGVRTRPKCKKYERAEE